MGTWNHWWTLFLQSFLTLFLLTVPWVSETFLVNIPAAREKTLCTQGILTVNSPNLVSNESFL